MYVDQTCCFVHFSIMSARECKLEIILSISAGEIVNLISVDSQKIEDACLMLNLLWSCPLQVGLAVYFLYQTIGVAVFVGRLPKKVY